MISRKFATSSALVAAARFVGEGGQPNPHGHDEDILSKADERWSQITW